MVCDYHKEKTISKYKRIIYTIHHILWSYGVQPKKVMAQYIKGRTLDKSL